MLAIAFSLLLTAENLSEPQTFSNVEVVEVSEIPPDSGMFEFWYWVRVTHPTGTDEAFYIRQMSRLHQNYPQVGDVCSIVAVEQMINGRTANEAVPVRAVLTPSSMVCNEVQIVLELQ